MSGIAQLLPPIFAFAITYAGFSWISARLSEEAKGAIERWIACAAFLGFMGAFAFFALRSFASVSSALFTMMLGSTYLLWGIVRLVKRSWRRRAAPADAGHVAYALVLIFVAGIGESKFLETYENSFEPLFTALEAYRREYDAYPAELSRLTPDYIESLPRCPIEPSYGPAIAYSATNEDFSVECVVGYSLLFPYRGWYRSEYGEWLYYD